MRTLSLIVAVTLGSTAFAGDVGTGAISGVVRLSGPVPSVPFFTSEPDLEICGTQPRPLQSLVLGTNQAVRDAVVYLGAVGANGRHAASDGLAVLDQLDCEFVPRIQIAHSGAMLTVRNSDPVLHVVRLESLSGTNGPTPLLNLAMPYAGDEKKLKLASSKEPMLLKATCGNGHAWMVAYLAVMPHTWAAMTDEYGRFTSSRVPPGAYKLFAWHEVLGTLVREIKVSSGRATNVDLEFTSTVRK